MSDPTTWPRWAHLGPDEQVLYTHSIADAIAASWEQYARLECYAHDGLRQSDLVVVATTECGVIDVSHEGRGAVAYWDPFAPASGDQPQSRPFSWENRVSGFVPLGFVMRMVENYLSSSYKEWYGH